MPPPRRLVTLLVLAIIAAAISAAVLARLLAGDDFPTLGIAIWWAAQTVTTVGYGDVIPESTVGRVVAGGLMVAGYAFVSLLTAAVAAAFIRRQQARRRPESMLAPDPVMEALDRIEARLEALERRLG